MEKPLAGLSIDLDDLWCYLKEKGDPKWIQSPTFFPTVLPTILNITEALQLQLTFFIVGHDALLPQNRVWMQAITAKGHEVGNHSLMHNPAPRTRDRASLLGDIQKSQEAIAVVCGKTPVGFRGPGFTTSPDLLEILNEEGFLYDSSSLPTFLSPLARLFYFWKAGLNGEEKRERGELYGSFTQGFQSNKPYLKTLNNSQTLLELPVTTIPFVKTPFHMSYLFFLYGISPKLMNVYLKGALRACHVTGTSPNFLLHPTDFVGADLVPQLSFFPGMQLSSATKVQVVVEVLNTIQKHFQFVPLITLAKRYHE